MVGGKGVVGGWGEGVWWVGKRGCGGQVGRGGCGGGREGVLGGKVITSHTV